LHLAWFPFLILHTEFLLAIEGAKYDRAEVTFPFDPGEKFAEHVDYALAVNEGEKLLEDLPDEDEVVKVRGVVL